MIPLWNPGSADTISIPKNSKQSEVLYHEFSQALALTDVR